VSNVLISSKLNTNEIFQNEDILLFDRGEVGQYDRDATEREEPEQGRGFDT